MKGSPKISSNTILSELFIYSSNKNNAHAIIGLSLLLFNVVPSRTEAQITPQKLLFISLFTEVCVLQLQPHYHSHFHIIINLKSGPPRSTFTAGKK